VPSRAFQPRVREKRGALKPDDDEEDALFLSLEEEEERERRRDRRGCRLARPQTQLRTVLVVRG